MSLYLIIDLFAFWKVYHSLWIASFKRELYSEIIWWKPAAKRQVFLSLSLALYLPNFRLLVEESLWQKKNTLTLTHICIYTNSCHVHQSFALLFLNVHSVWSLLALSTNESFAVWIVMAHPVEWYDSWWSSILTSRQKPSIIKIVRMRETCFCICFTIIQHPTSSIIFVVLRSIARCTQSTEMHTNDLGIHTHTHPTNGSKKKDKNALNTHKRNR